MTATTSRPGAKVAATGQLTTLPGGTQQKVALGRPKPAIVILIHGVNDVGEAYIHQEAGLCQGLSERLDRMDASRLRHAFYRVPSAKDRMAPNPDAVYFRRQHVSGVDPANPVNSPVIPFYWGYREEEGKYKDPGTGKLRPFVNKTESHGEYLDRYGNRLDKDSSKNGGPFANATSNLPDMWSEGFSGGTLGTPFPTNRTPVSTPGHPLHPGAPRHYMVLAAQRLAMLVRMIRRKSPDDTLNVVAHSQGCLISLLANAFLKDSGDRPVDVLVMNHPPYSLEEKTVEGLERGRAQQTTMARLRTLQGIVGFMTAAPHVQPAFDALNASATAGAISGGKWHPQTGTKTLDGVQYVSQERDNRGKVYLYFCPNDQTVSLLNMAGIGWQGVPDHVHERVPAQVSVTYTVYDLAPGARREARRHEALAALGPRFKQRVFTNRKRGGKAECVGETPHDYTLEKFWELAWSGTELGAGNLGRAGFSANQTVRITGEELNPPIEPDLGPAWLDISPIDASIAITAPQWRRVLGPILYTFPWLAQQPKGLLHDEPAAGVGTTLNGGKDVADQTLVTQAEHLGEGRTKVWRTETPNEARQRWMDTKDSEDNKNSFHSSIVSNPEHSRMATAYDLAIGQARAIDDPVYHLYLCLVADWRTNWEEDLAKIEKKDLTVAQKNLYRDAFALLNQESGLARQWIDLNIFYRATGKFREEGKSFPEVIDCPLPSLVVSQTRGART